MFLLTECVDTFKKEYERTSQEDFFIIYVKVFSLFMINDYYKGNDIIKVLESSVPVAKNSWS